VQVSGEVSGAVSAATTINTSWHAMHGCPEPCGGSAVLPHLRPPNLFLLHLASDLAALLLFLDCVVTPNARATSVAFTLSRASLVARFAVPKPVSPLVGITRFRFSTAFCCHTITWQNLSAVPPILPTTVLLTAQCWLAQAVRCWYGRWPKLD
jgi:hypothetical protein